jgi:hypothetical protein
LLSDLAYLNRWNTLYHEGQVLISDRYPQQKREKEKKKDMVKKFVVKIWPIRQKENKKWQFILIGGFLQTSLFVQVSISPTFDVRLLGAKVFLYLHFRFLVQEYWRKCSHKMLLKLTTIFQPTVNFTNILYAAFLYFFDARISAQKLFLKCW